MDEASHVSKDSWSVRMLPLEKHLPYVQIKSPNPVFEYERQRTGRIPTATDLAEFTLSVGVVIPVIAGLTLCCIVTLIPDPRNNIYSDFFRFLTFFNLVMIALSNAYYAVVATVSIHQHFSPDFRDFLHLTTLSKQDIMLAQHTMIQIRLWRVMTVECGLRTLLIVFGWPVIFRLHRIADIGIPLYITVIWVLALIVVALSSILEPLWRMKTTTAMGISMVSRTNSMALAIVSTVLIMLVTEVFLIYGGYILTSGVLTVVFQNSHSEEQALLLDAISVACTLFMLYPVFKGLQRTARHYCKIASNRSWS